MMEHPLQFYHQVLSALCDEMAFDEVVLAYDGVFYGASRAYVCVIKDHAVSDVRERLDRDIVSDGC